MNASEATMRQLYRHRQHRHHHHHEHANAQYTAADNGRVHRSSMRLAGAPSASDGSRAGVLDALDEQDHLESVDIFDKSLDYASIERANDNRRDTARVDQSAREAPLAHTDALTIDSSVVQAISAKIETKFQRRMAKVRRDVHFQDQCMTHERFAADATYRPFQ